MKINIALCANELFAIPCMITIITIMENNKCSNFSFYVLNDGFTEATRAKFQKLADLYHCKISLIEKDTEELKGVDANHRYSIMTYYRFFIPEILNDIEKIIYMDSDMMVRGSLDELWNTDLTDKACAAVVDQNCDDVTNYNRLSLDAEQYFNAGMLLINLDYWRRNDIAHKCLNYILENPEKCKYNDQDALNVILNKHITTVSPTFNFQEGWYNPISHIFYHYKKIEVINTVKNNPVIVHFNTETKPWHNDCLNPWTEEYLSYAQLHPFIGFKKRNLHSIAYRVCNKLSWIFVEIRNSCK